MTFAFLTESEFTQQALRRRGRTTAYEYDSSGNVTRKTLPNLDVISTNYDALNRPIVIEGETVGTLAYPQGRPLYLYALSYDALGNLRESVESADPTSNLGPRTLRLSYDAAYRLTREEVSDVAGFSVTTHGYDLANNRISKTLQGANSSGTTYTYNALNQLVSVSGLDGNVAFSYDPNGNRFTRTRNTTEVTNYVYDGESRLTSVTGNYRGVTLNLQYDYDYRTRRILRTEAGSATRVSYSGGTSVQEWQNSVISAEFVRGSDRGGGIGGLLYSLRPVGPISFSHYNHRGDVVAKTDGAGSLLWQAEYEGFGKRTHEWGTTADRQKANTKEEDPGGLLNEGMRYRDLETDAFITRDPAGFVDGPNLYAYVQQNPWSKFDPEGLESSVVGDDVLSKITRALDTLKGWFKGGEQYGGGNAPGRKAADKVVDQVAKPVEGAVKTAQAGERIKNQSGTGGTVAGSSGPNLNDTVEFLEGAQQLGNAIPNSQSPGGKTASDQKAQSDAAVANATNGPTKEELDKAYPRVTPSKGFADKVMEANRAKDGKVYYPSGVEIKPGAYWELGHKPGHKFEDAQRRAYEQQWPDDMWRQYQKTPDIYRPELRPTNRGHRYESDY